MAHKKKTIAPDALWEVALEKKEQKKKQQTFLFAKIQNVRNLA